MLGLETEIIWEIIKSSCGQNILCDVMQIYDTLHNRLAVRYGRLRTWNCFTQYLSNSIIYSHFFES